MAKKKTSEVVSIPAPDIRVLKVRITGTTGLIVHRFAEKARKQIEDKQAGKAKQGRERRKPDEEYKAAMYVMSGEGKKLRCGFPATGLKCAMIRAADYVPDLTMTRARGMFFVKGENIKGEDLVEIKGGDPYMRTDVIRLQGKTADMRYRPEWLNWHMDLEIQYNAFIVSAEQVMNLLAIAGFSVGLGDWRPEKSGTHGMFTPVADAGAKGRKVA